MDNFPYYLYVFAIRSAFSTVEDFKAALDTNFDVAIAQLLDSHDSSLSEYDGLLSALLSPADVIRIAGKYPHHTISLLEAVRQTLSPQTFEFYWVTLPDYRDTLIRVYHPLRDGGVGDITYHMVCKDADVESLSFLARYSTYSAAKMLAEAIVEHRSDDVELMREVTIAFFNNFNVVDRYAEDPHISTLPIIHYLAGVEGTRIYAGGHQTVDMTEEELRQYLLAKFPDELSDYITDPLLERTGVSDLTLVLSHIAWRSDNLVIFTKESRFNTHVCEAFIFEEDSVLQLVLTDDNDNGGTTLARAFRISWDNALIPLNA